MTLLYIDDDDDDRTMFVEAIESSVHPCQCLVASGGKQALAMLNSVFPDIIFLDVNMPEMNGVDVLQALRKNPRFKDVKIVIFSTSVQPEDCVRYRTIGANDCLAKPTSFSKLCRLLNSFLMPPGTEGVLQLGRY